LGLAARLLQHEAQDSSRRPVHLRENARKDRLFQRASMGRASVIPRGGTSGRRSQSTTPATLSAWARGQETHRSRAPRRERRSESRRRATQNSAQSVRNSRSSITFSPSRRGCCSRNRASGHDPVDVSQQHHVRPSPLRIGRRWRRFRPLGGGVAGGGHSCSPHSFSPRVRRQAVSLGGSRTRLPMCRSRLKLTRRGLAPSAALGRSHSGRPPARPSLTASREAVTVAPRRPRDESGADSRESNGRRMSSGSLQVSTVAA
jgi:hypothetical protein